MKQKQIFYRTALKKISITKTGEVRNNKTKNLLKVSKRAYFTLNGKPINLPKLMLQTFKQTPIKSGRIEFKDGNDTNFKIENIDYVTKLDKITPPMKSDLKKVIECYFKDKSFAIGDYIQTRLYLQMILNKRRFFEDNSKSTNIDVFKDYFSPGFPNLINLAKRNSISVLDAKRTVYFFLNKLISDCLNDEDLKRSKM